VKREGRFNRFAYSRPGLDSAYPRAHGGRGAGV